MQWGKRQKLGSGSQQRGAKQPTRSQVMALCPMRNPQLAWYEEEGRVVLHIKRAHTWKTRLLQVFFPLPEERRIVLDAIGTDVWQMMDGKTTMGQIAKALGSKYQLGPRETELSLQQFFKEIGRRGYMGFWGEGNSTKLEQSEQPEKTPLSTGKAAPKMQAKAKVKQKKSGVKSQAKRV
ncbi:MAG: PqqD family protein [Abitibacteriaceae bacterium]|nr:PqqD family protein [Abditibacteriaceae bacterium]